MQHYTVYFIWKLLYMFRVVPPPIIRSATTVSTASGICHTVTDDGWWYHPKHVEQLPGKINCVMLHYVGYTVYQNILTMRGPMNYKYVIYIYEKPTYAIHKYIQ